MYSVDRSPFTGPGSTRGVKGGRTSAIKEFNIRRMPKESGDAKRYLQSRKSALREFRSFEDALKKVEELGIPVKNEMKLGLLGISLKRGKPPAMRIVRKAINFFERSPSDFETQDRYFKALADVDAFFWKDAPYIQMLKEHGWVLLHALAYSRELNPKVDRAKLQKDLEDLTGPNSLKRCMKEGYPVSPRHIAAGFRELLSV